MQTTKELTKKEGLKPKLLTMDPKRMPTYVIAFAVQETFDDPLKLQHLTNKTSVEISTPSISPKDSNNSAKTFIISPTEQLPNERDTAALSEVKLDIVDDNQCGDMVEKKSSQISSIIVIDSVRTADEHLEILFNTPKHIKRYKSTNRFTSKKPKKSKRVINFKNIHYKYKKTKISITRRLEKYYEKTKSNTPNAKQIHSQIYYNVLSQVVSRSRVLKKVLAKENLLADSDQISSLDGVSVIDYDIGSMNSSPSTTKKSFISYTSQNTLIGINFASSSNENLNNITTANSIIQITSDNQLPYKSEIINASLAVAYTANDSKTNIDQTAASSNETLIHKENLTSSETFLKNNTTELTSKPTSSEEPKYKIEYDDLTIIPNNLNEIIRNNENQEVQSDSGVRSDDNTFVVTETDSDFNKSSMHSDCTLTFNSESTFPTENMQSGFFSNEELTENVSNKTTLLDKVKFLGFYPTRSPSNDSSANLGSDLNDVLVTDCNYVANSFPVTSQNITEELATDTQNTNVLRKPIDLNNMTYLQNNISLPNDVSIKAKLKEVQEARISCPDSIKNKHPTDMAEMWEQLTIVIDYAVKRLEDTIRESLAILLQPDCKTPTVEIQRVETKLASVSCDRPIPTMLHKEIFVIEDHLKRDADMCVQCDLVQRQIIDQLMLKLSAEAPKPITPSAEALKILQPPELMKDYLEVLKPPVALAKESTSMETGKIDVVTVSLATTPLSSRSGLYRFKRLFAYPVAFLRENALVLTSVPTFFIVLLCIYGVMVIILNP